MLTEKISLSVLKPRHICKPIGSCDSLVDKLKNLEHKDEGTKIVYMMWETFCDGGGCYSALRSQLGGPLEDSSLVAMGRIRYFATMDLIFSLLVRYAPSRDTTIKLLRTTSNIMFDREVDTGETNFLAELEYFRPLDREIRGKVYSAIRSYRKIVGLDNNEAYLRSAKGALLI